MKYLKPFFISVLLVFALLFMQALCDLNLPNYMSDIVNVGIQQGGIQSAAPDAISEQGMEFVGLFMSDEGAQTAADMYVQQDGRLMLRTDITAQQKEALEYEFEMASATMIAAMQSFAQQLGDGGGMGELGGQIDMTRLYAAAPMIKLMIPAERMEALREEAAATGEMLRRQYAVALVRGYYGELDMDMAALQRGYILSIGARMLLIALIGGIATVLVGLLSSRMAAGVAKSLRQDVFAKVASFSAAEVNRFGAASLITRTTNDIQQVQMLIQMGTRMILYSPIMCLGGIIMALQKSVSMSWILALAGIVLVGLIVVLMSVATPKFKILQKLVDRLNLVAREQLTGLMVIRAFGTTRHEAARFDEANSELTRVQLFVNRAMSLMMPLMTLVMSGSTLLIMWVGAHQVAASGMQVGDMMAFMQYAMQIIMSFLFMSMVFVFLPRAAVSMARIADVLETEPTIKDPDVERPFVESMQGVVQFDDVCFKYEGAEENALEHISFTALPGETTAIIGSTGSGKSTVANMILRFYDATTGRVLVDGVDVRDVSQASLRARIGYVPQKGVLLSGTIDSNLRYGNEEATDEQIRDVAAVAQALDFIEAKPDGFDAEIAQGGDNVSGGQKQRLSIARALAKRPEILIFDDSFSALDFKTDVTLRKALFAHAANSTVIIVAQRVSTVLNAQKILVMDEGRIVGSGTHRELLTTCEAYREIARSQLSEEELA